MKYLSILTAVIFCTAACGPDSSPEKRMKLNIDSIQRQIDSLKLENREIKDSINNLKLRLK